MSVRLDIDSIGCFVAAAHTLNFRAAARSEALTPAALGKRIQGLEDVLGVKLFERTTRSVQLTEAGRALLPEAQKLLAQSESCALAAQGESGAPALELVLGTRYELGMSWILPVRDALKDALPHVTFHLYFGSAPELEARILSMEVDCAVTSRAPSTRRVGAISVHREDYVFVGAPALLAEQPLAEPKQALRHVLIDAHEDLPLFGYWRNGSAPDVLLRFARVLRAGTIAAIRALVLAGEGVAVLPLYFVRDDLERGDLERVMPDVSLAADHFRLLYRAGDAHEPVFDTVAEVMRGTPLR